MEETGYKFISNVTKTETTVYHKGVPIYRFGTNPTQDLADYDRTCEYFASLFGRVLRVGH